MLKTRLLAAKDGEVIEEAKCEECFKWFAKTDGIVTYYNNDIENYKCIPCWRNADKDNKNPLSLEDLAFTHTEFCILQEAMNKVGNSPNTGFGLNVWVKDISTGYNRSVFLPELDALKDKLKRIIASISIQEKETEHDIIPDYFM